jgi:hypothetical protein
VYTLGSDAVFRQNTSVPSTGVFRQISVVIAYQFSVRFQLGTDGPPFGEVPFIWLPTSKLRANFAYCDLGGCIGTCLQASQLVVSCAYVTHAVATSGSRQATPAHAPAAMLHL